MEIHPVWWVRSLSIPKMSVFLIPPDRISTVSIQFQHLCSGDEKLNLKSTWKGKATTITTRILKNKQGNEQRCGTPMTRCQDWLYTRSDEHGVALWRAGKSVGGRPETDAHTVASDSLRRHQGFWFSKAVFRLMLLENLNIHTQKKLIHILPKIQTVLLNEWWT